MAVNAVVIGAGGFGRETLDVIEAWNSSGLEEPFNVLGVIDDSPSILNLERLQRRGYRHLGGFETLGDLPLPFVYFVGIGSPEVRSDIATRCEALGLAAGIVVHPTASIGTETQLGAGTVICGGAQVSTNVRLGRHVHLNPASVVGHDSTVGDFTSVNPAAVLSGNVVVEDLVLIGAGAVVLQGLQVGEGATVGASACVVRTVPQRSLVVGVPARTGK